TDRGGPRVRLLRQESAVGRFRARLLGSEAARGERILFIDSRLELAEGFAEGLTDLARDYKAAMGVVEILPKDVFCLYWDRSHRVIFREHFDAIAHPFDLTAENYDRLLKGTSVFMCDRELFLKTCATFDADAPPRNDDTWLMRRIVDQTPIRVDARLTILWEPRRDTKAFLGRLFERGPSFVEYHVFEHRGFFFYAVIAGLLYVLATLVLIPFAPALALASLALGLLGASVSVFAFARGPLEAIRMLPLHLGVFLSFGTGILWGLVLNSWERFLSNPAQRQMTLATLVMAGAQGVTHGLNYLFQIVVGRWVSPGIYGEFQSLLAIVSIAGLAVVPLSWIISRQVAQAAEQNHVSWLRSALRRYGLATAGLGGGAVLLAWALAAPAGEFFRLTDPFAVSAAAVYFAANLVFVLASAFVLGHGDYQTLNGINVGYSTLRLAIAWPVAWAIGTASVAVVAAHPQGALFLGQATAAGAFGLGTAFVLSRRYGASEGSSTPVSRIPFRDASLTVIAQLAASVFLHADVLYLQRNFPAVVDEGYAGASVLAKVAVFLPTVATTIVFPKLARASEAERSGLLRFALRLGVAIAAVSTLGLVAAPELWLTLLMGTRYASAGPMLAMATIPLAMGGLASGILQLAVARRNHRALWAMIAAGGACWLGLLALPPSLAVLFSLLAAASTSAFVAGAWLLLHEAR
ncbi:MAG: hypothetical protein AAFX94_00995, partial [Myxococcota bacterium]